MSVTNLQYGQELIKVAADGQEEFKCIFRGSIITELGDVRIIVGFRPTGSKKDRSITYL